MAIQAEKLQSLLAESGFRISAVRTNPVLPGSIAWMERLPVIRGGVKTILFFDGLRRAAKQANVVYFLSGFFNFFWWRTFPALVLLFLWRRKVILSARGGAAGLFFDRFKRLLRPLMKRIDLITTPSAFLQREFVRAFGIRPEVVPNIADLKQFRFRRREPLMPRLIVTRNLEAIYNVGCVIRAFARVHERFPAATLAVAGDGPERASLQSLVDELGLQRAVTFHGRVPHDRVQDLYDANDIYVNGSIVDNLPGVILEAMASGLPIVTTRAGGIPYMVEDGATALLAECNDSAGLAARVCQLLAQPALAATLAANARRACEAYSPENVRRILAPLLSHVIAG